MELGDRKKKITLTISPGLFFATGKWRFRSWQAVQEAVIPKSYQVVARQRHIVFSSHPARPMKGLYRIEIGRVKLFR